MPVNGNCSEDERSGCSRHANEPRPVQRVGNSDPCILRKGVRSFQLSPRNGVAARYQPHRFGYGPYERIRDLTLSEGERLSFRLEQNQVILERVPDSWSVVGDGVDIIMGADDSIS